MFIKNGYRLKFFFDSNPYFENDTIVKEYNWSSVSEPKIQTTEVKWKTGKKKLGHNGGGGRAAAAGATNGVGERSFFDWLCYDTDPLTDEFAEVIKDDIWYYPLLKHFQKGKNK